jgi:signal transduction histidine kinase
MNEGSTQDKASEPAGGSDEAGPERLADFLDGRRETLLARYQNALTALGNAVAADQAALDQARENASQILTDVSDSLRAGRAQVRDDYHFLAWNIGMSRAAGGVHPSVSLQASSTFFSIVLAEAAEGLDYSSDDFTLLTATALALERSITLRVRTAIAAYTSFLLNQIREAQISERRRIARDLHDRIGPGISATQRLLELYTFYQDVDSGKAGQKVEVARQTILESLHNLRAVMSDLYTGRPVVSLEKSLASYFESADADGVDVRVRVNGDEAWAGPEVLDEMFLVLREAARNALRHAEAGMLVVNVDITPTEIRAFVEDDGKGFDTSRPPASRGLGLSSMSERASLLGGTFWVRSRPGQGTHVDFAVPLTGRRPV